LARWITEVREGQGEQQLEAVEERLVGSSEEEKLLKPLTQPPE
jgi:hypothetical protein